MIKRLITLAVMLVSAFGIAVALAVILLATSAFRTATWTDNSGGTASTEVWRALGVCESAVGPDAGSLPWSTLTTTAPGVSIYVDNEVLVPGQTYCFRLRACADSICSPFSNMVDFVEPRLTPPSPTALMVTQSVLWKFCANEDAVCSFITDTKTLRYGDDTAGYKIMTFTKANAVLCANAVFGGDPAPGIRKHCDTQQ